MLERLESAFLLYAIATVTKMKRKMVFRIHIGHHPHATSFANGENLKMRMMSVRIIQSAQEATRISNRSRSLSTSILHEDINDARISGNIEAWAREAVVVAPYPEASALPSGTELMEEGAFSTVGSWEELPESGLITELCIDPWSDACMDPDAELAANCWTDSGTEASASNERLSSRTIM